MDEIKVIETYTLEVMTSNKRWLTCIGCETITLDHGLEQIRIARVNKLKNYRLVKVQAITLKDIIQESSDG